MADLTEALKPELWTVSSNEALKIFLTNNGSAVPIKPAFTYPIFGDSESIFGYKNLTIFLCFDHYTFYPFLNVKDEGKLNDSVVDPKKQMLQYLPETTVFKDEMAWLEATAIEKQEYKIPGEKVASFDGKYDIYKINIKDIAGVELLKRLQILVLLFIEAGSFIDHKDELWDLYVIYGDVSEPFEGADPEPSIVGFVTAYNYWKYAGAKGFDQGVKQTRKKISQFVILPNFQGQHIGSKVYLELYKTWLKDDEVYEVVVEDPNEAFDDMRDKSDLNRLNLVINVKDIDFTKIKEPGWLESFRLQQKLEKRQFSRLVEMILLHNLKLFGGNQKDIRLYIKTRLYEKNKDALNSLEKPVRMDKLQTAYQALEEDYYRILQGLKLGKRELEGEREAKRIKA
jgi:histone acetyltransferase 1